MTKLTGIKGFNYKRLAQEVSDLSQDVSLSDPPSAHFISDKILQQVQDSLIEEGYVTSEDFYEDRIDHLSQVFLDTITPLLSKYIDSVLKVKQQNSQV